MAQSGPRAAWLECRLPGQSGHPFGLDECLLMTRSRHAAFNHRAHPNSVPFTIAMRVVDLLARCELEDSRHEPFGRKGPDDMASSLASNPLHRGRP